jgi:hypothetical protein
MWIILSIMAMVSRSTLVVVETVCFVVALKVMVRSVLDRGLIWILG